MKTFKVGKYTEIIYNPTNGIWIKSMREPFMLYLLKLIPRLLGFFKGKWYHIAIANNSMYVDGEEVK